jgi:hydrophobic/amphiphilic exporter-1 (mainly G- bacteria), HAE1 family
MHITSTAAVGDKMKHKNNIAFFSIKRPIFIASITVLLLTVGGISFKRIGVDLFPDVDPTSIQINIAYPGASPEEVEKLVTKPVEDQVSSIAGLKRLTSTNLEGYSVINAEFILEIDLKYAEQQLRDKVAAARPELPVDIDEPKFFKRDISSMPILRYSFESDLPPTKAYDLLNETIKVKIQQVNNVGDIDIIGGRKREIQVELDRNKLNEYRIPASTVVNQFRNAGVNVPAGKFEKGATETVFRTLGEFEDVKSIGDTVVQFSGDVSNSVTVKNLGKIVDGMEDIISTGYLYYPYEMKTVKKGLIFKSDVETEVKVPDAKTRPALILLIYKQSGSNTVQVSDAVKVKINKINDEIKNMEGKPRLVIASDFSKSIRDNLDDVIFTIIFGIILAVITVYLFLGNLRSTIITGIAIPTSLMGAFIMMYVAGFTLNLMSLMALSLAVGLLIDDSIVIQENIYRKRETGLSPFDAAGFGTEEVKLAVIATTLVVISVFMPVGFLSGTIGRFFRPFGFSVVFAMTISLLASLTLAPLLNAYFAGSGHKNNNIVIRVFDRFQDAIDVFYEKVVDFALANPLKIILGVILLFAVSMLMMAGTPKTFQPDAEATEFNLNLELPSGTSLDGTKALTEKIEPIIRDIKEIKYYTLQIGNMRGEVNKATFGIKCFPRKEREIDSNTIKQMIRKKMKDDFAQATPSITNAFGGNAGMKPFNLNLMGEDLDQLNTYSDLLISKMKGIKDLTEISSSNKTGKPEFQVRLDPKKMVMLGVQPKAVGDELRTHIAGTAAAKLRESGLEYNIRVRLKPDQRNMKENYQFMRVPNTMNKLVAISDISNPKSVIGPAVILREDRARINQIGANLAPGGAIGDAVKKVNNLLKDNPPPAGVTFKFVGQSQDFEDLKDSFVLAFVLSLLFIFLVLASLYDSFITPITILTALPPALSGAFAGVFIAHLFHASIMFDMFSMIGLIALLGLVTKNSILLVDFALEGLRAGMTQKEAIKRAGMTRLRPILMTSVAIITGTLPLAMGVGEAAAYRKSMGIAIIGGVMVSTIVTLVVVPAIFEYIDKFRGFVERRVLDKDIIKAAYKLNVHDAQELIGESAVLHHEKPKKPAKKK